MLAAWIVTELDSTDFGFHAALSSDLAVFGTMPTLALGRAVHVRFHVILH